MAKTAIGFGLALAALTALVVLGVFSAGDKPGFLALGLLIADFNLALDILLVLGLTVGAHLARRGSIEASRKAASDGSEIFQMAKVTLFYNVLRAA